MQSGFIAYLDSVKARDPAARSRWDDPRTVPSDARRPTTAASWAESAGTEIAVTTIISILGIVGRAVGRVLTSSLGWATSHVTPVDGT